MQGRKTGSGSRNKFSIVYKMMKERGDVPEGYGREDTMRLLTMVGDKLWELVYDGHIVAVPGLFNMEIRPNMTKWPKRVNWKRTLKLWSEDSEAHKEKLLVRSAPTEHFLRVRRSTIGSKRNRWYYPLMLEVRPCKGKMKQINDKYRL